MNSVRAFDLGRFVGNYCYIELHYLSLNIIFVTDIDLYKVANIRHCN